MSHDILSHQFNRKHIQENHARSSLCNIVIVIYPYISIYIYICILYIKENNLHNIHNGNVVLKFKMQTSMRPGGRRNGTDFSQNLCPAESSNQHNHLTKTRVSLRWKWWNNGGLTWFKHLTLGKMMVLWLSHCDNSPSNTGNFNGGSTLKTLETNWTKWWFYMVLQFNQQKWFAAH